ncbi:MAG: hypothetical protein ACYTEL_06890 [Planctomycetota bacterium]|jgi:hypothetical protein
MKTVISISAWMVMVAITVCGCKPEEGRRETEPVGMKHETELQATWDRLDKKVMDNPDLWPDVERVVKRRIRPDWAGSKKEGFQQLYSLLKDDNARASAASEALDVFVKLGATEVVRESLLNSRDDVPGWGLVITASKALRNVSDEKAIPHMVYVLEQNNYHQPGSEAATMHRRMKRELALAMADVTDLDLRVDDTDLNDKKQVQRVLTEVRGWAKKNGIQLFDE